MASTGEIKAQIQGALEQADEATGTITAAMSQLDAAISAATGATDGTSSTEPGEALGQWRQARDELENSIGAIQAAKSTFETYMSSI